MTPTIVLKSRADRAMKQEAAARLMTEESHTTGNFESADRQPQSISAIYRHETEDDAAKLLLSMSEIVSNEIKNNAFAFDDDGDHCSRDDSSRCSHESNQDSLLLTPRQMNQSPTHCDSERFNWTRVRTVSIDSPLHTSLLTPKAMDEELPKPCTLSLIRPALISPLSTPIGRGRPIRRASLKFAQKIKQEHIKIPKLPQLPPVTVDVNEYKKKALQSSLAKGMKIQTIGRKKFSWKNYPELEAFLIANREEYLRHSALNYTVQQKQYNNRLTEQLLELAAEHGYIFDDVEFNFVTVRDRIRCYFKSYVQSAKKRGITVGYAARKAGLLSEDDLRVDDEGEIVVPDNL